VIIALLALGLVASCGGESAAAAHTDPMAEVNTMVAKGDEQLAKGNKSGALVQLTRAKDQLDKLVPTLSGDDRIRAEKELKALSDRLTAMALGGL
jgi:hypothetical protein